MKCGVGAYTKRLASSLAQFEDINVTVLTDARVSEATKVKGVDVLPVMDGWRLAKAIQVFGIIRKLKPDVMHIQYPTQGYSGRLPLRLPILARLMGKPCVQTWHEPIPGGRGLWLAVGLSALIRVKEDLMTNLPCATQMAIVGAKSYWIQGASILPTANLSQNERLAIKHRYVDNRQKLMVFYGFVAPLKGIEALLEIVERTGIKLLLICDFQQENSYHRSLLEKIQAIGLDSKITITGFLPDDELACILAASDVVVFPFRDGVRAWNTSVDGAIAQGVFVLATSTEIEGYKKEKNIYFVKPGNVEEMIMAIQKYAGCRVASKSSVSEWRHIAEQHLSIYKSLI